MAAAADWLAGGGRGCGPRSGRGVRAGPQSRARPRSRRRQSRAQLLLWPHGGRPMGTPASVACDPLQRQAPEARARKRASANIFQGVGLLQLGQLFRSSGDARAEERAQLVLGYAGDRRTAQALRQLRGRQRRGRLPPQLSPAAQDSNHPRLEDSSSPGADPGSTPRLEGPSRTGPRTRRRKRGPGPTGYLHQLQQ
ncbi:arginine vasopressin-induced protein 1 [Eretmochelys imbricata]